VTWVKSHDRYTLVDYKIQKESTVLLVLWETESEETSTAAAGASVAVSSQAPLLLKDVRQAPYTMSVPEAEEFFMTRFNFSVMKDNLLETRPEEIKKQEEDADRRSRNFWIK
jgi:hypothetical protein